MIVPLNNDYLAAQCPKRHWLTFNKKLQPTSYWGQAKKDCITEFGHTYIFVCSSFSNIILRWGSPMTCNKKILKKTSEREFYILLEKRVLIQLCEEDSERSNIYIEKSCNTAHVKRKRTATTSTCCCFCCYKPFLCSHFLFLLSPSLSLSVVSF